jgi:hypothetical protein
MLNGNRVEALKAKHASLEDAIEREGSRPYPDTIVLVGLKRRKLQIKDEIVRLTSN